MIGWAPRYVVGDLLQAIADCSEGLSARVARVNEPPAPHNQRVLIEMTGRFRENFEPMSSEEYLPVAAYVGG